MFLQHLSVKKIARQMRRLAGGALFLWAVACAGFWFATPRTKAQTTYPPTDYWQVLRPRPAQVPQATRTYTPQELEVIQAFELQQKLTASDGAAGSQLGISVAISGETAIIGASAADNIANIDQGAAYIYTRTGTTWTQQTKLLANDGAAGDQFGVSVALDGTTALIGAYTDDTAGVIDQGSAYVFVGSGANWMQQAKLLATGGVEQDLFGFAVAVQSNTAVITAPFADEGAFPNAGAAYIFTRTGTDWTQQQRIVAANAAEDDNFGSGLALNNDTFIVGALNSDAGGSINQGAAYVFTRSGTTWTQQAQLLAGDGASGDLFGISVGVSGNTALIGANFDDIGANIAQGSAYIFTRTGTAWAQQQKLTASDGAAGDGFGVSVAVLGDTAAVGAPDRANNGNSSQGAIYTYNRTGTAWTADPVLVASDGAANDSLGIAVALNGTTLAGGAAFDDINANADQGSAYLYTVSGPRLSVGNVSLNEGNSGTTTATFTVSLTPAATGTVTVNYATANGTATAGSDYVATNGTLTFTAGQISRTFTVTINGDTTYEADETFLVNLSGATGATIGNGQGTGTILNDDALPTLSVNDVNVLEGNSGLTSANFTVSLSAASGLPASVAFSVGGGTAESGTDYLPVRLAEVNFPAGTTTQTITVSVIGDTLVEPDETFFVSLSGATGATIARAQGTGTILNDDANAILQFTGTAFTDNESGGRVTFAVSRSGVTANAVTVDYRTNDNLNFVECTLNNGTAQQRCDYIATSGRLNFAAGEISKTFTVPVIDDSYVEGSETFSVTLSNPSSGAALGTNAIATATLTDNDTATASSSVFVAQLSAAQEVPTNNSPANGSGTVTLNTAETQITVNLSFTGLTSAQTAAHIHGPAQVGVNAPILFNLGLGTISGATFNVTPAQVAQLKAGLFYFNVHTANFGGGEIRGQILANPLEVPRFFVRQQYLDFLNREPDTAGSDFWTNEIVGNCGTDLTCLNRRRIEVSAAFFIELEFQETGAYVYRLYKAAFGEQFAYRPTYAQFVPDRARVVGGTDVNAGKLNLANDFVTRSEFVARYPASQTPTQFVDAILATVQAGAGVTFTTAERNSFISDATTGRGLMLRNLGDNAAFRAAVNNRAFVLMQYFGYLRRDPDQAGYDFWLGVLNGQPNNPRGMVCAFVTAAEYQQRFSGGVTRSNANCNGF